MELTRAEIFMGPLPPPDTLAQYKTVDPTFAERIVSDFEARTAMARDQARHRQEIELRVVKGNVFAQKAGLVSAFVPAAGTIGGGVWLAATDHAVGGVSAIVTAIAGLAGVFVYGRQRQTQELTKKRAADLVRNQQRRS